MMATIPDLQGLLATAAGLAPAAGAAAASTDLTWVGIGLGLLVLALLLFAVELFVPSGGMLGILCGLSALASVAAFFYHSPTLGLLALLAYVIATPFLMVYGVKFWSQTPIGRRLILGGTEDVTADGRDEETVEAAIEARRREIRAADSALVGRHGLTVTPLRPVGVIRVDDRRMDALADAGVIEADQEIVVVEVLDDQIKVRIATAEDRPRSSPASA